MEDKTQMVVGEVGGSTSYSTHFAKNFNIDGSPSGTDLEAIFNAPQENIDDIVGYAKYCYRKYGIITRVVNIIRDFGATGLKLEYPNASVKARTCIEEYNKQIKIDQLVRDFLYELVLTGNLACYDRDGKRVDIYPVNTIDVVPLIENNKQVIAYKLDDMQIITAEYPEEILKAIESAYPDEINQAQKDGKSLAILNSENAFFAKINSSSYEPYGVSVILPAFDDLAHKSLMKEAEKATISEIIDKIMLVKIGDADNVPNRNLIQEYTRLLDGVSGSVRMTVPYYVDINYIEPQTSIFSNEKYLEVDTDILNTLGISLSLIRGESGGNYSEGIINFAGLTRTIETVRQPLVDVIEGLYKNELRRRGIKETFCPTVSFNDVIIDKEQKINLVKDLFTSCGLPYQVLYEECGYNFDSLKLIRQQENEEKVEDIFSLHAQPFSGNDQQDEGGAPEKTLTERKTDKTTSNNDQPRTGLEKTNRTSGK